MGIDVIVKYHGALGDVLRELGAAAELLDESHAVVTLEENRVALLSRCAQIIHVEYPKTVWLPDFEAHGHCGALQLHDSTLSLRGRGTVIGIIDSGVAYTHPDFIRADKTSRIHYLYNQETDTEYTRDDINRALANDCPAHVLPQIDTLGHGTAVASIAARVAPEAELIVVKLGRRKVGAAASTIELMRALRYTVWKAGNLGLPCVVNVGFGTNDGAHDGRSLFETYINEIVHTWKCTVVVATGNEGNAAHHFSGQLRTGKTLPVRFTVAPNLPSFYLILRKNSADALTLELAAPNGERAGLEKLSAGHRLQGTLVTARHLTPTPYTMHQEWHFQFAPVADHVTAGAWTVALRGADIVDGAIDLWMPTREEVSPKSAFIRHSAEETATLPSTAANVISVGGYDAGQRLSSDFSGRGVVSSTLTKPDLVAPAVAVTSARLGGGYGAFTGTSFAAPFVTGAAALMMEWGIRRGHDPFLYGERLKASLIRSASRDNAVSYPNAVWGHGTLNIQNAVSWLNRNMW